MMGFALMAWELAKRRVPDASPSVSYYMRRDELPDARWPGSFPVHRAYYRILDDANHLAAWRRRWPHDEQRRPVRMCLDGFYVPSWVCP